MTTLAFVEIENRWERDPIWLRWDRIAKNPSPCPEQVDVKVGLYEISRGFWRVRSTFFSMASRVRGDINQMLSWTIPLFHVDGHGMLRWTQIPLDKPKWRNWQTWRNDNVLPDQPQMLLIWMISRASMRLGEGQKADLEILEDHFVSSRREKRQVQRESRRSLDEKFLATNTS